jgi:hypothetical protein
MLNFRQKSLLRSFADPMLFCGSAFHDIPQAVSISIQNKGKKMHSKGIPGMNYPIDAIVKCAILTGRVGGQGKHCRSCLTTFPTTWNGAFTLPIGQYIFVSHVGYQYVIILIVGDDIQNDRVRRWPAPWALVRAVECDITAVIRGKRLLWYRARRGVVVRIIPVSAAVELEELSC